MLAIILPIIYCLFDGLGTFLDAIYLDKLELISEDNSQISGNGAGKKSDPAMAIFGEGLKDYISKRRENN